MYSKKQITILDDVFSGLDTVTEEHISRSLFGQNGLLRGPSRTVILATHAVHLLDKADNIILLGENSKVLYQGRIPNLPEGLVPKRNFGESRGHEFPDNATAIETVELINNNPFVSTFHPAMRESDLAAPDISRQMGDFQVYKYYLKTMGLKHAILFAVLGAICMGFTPAQSEPLSICMGTNINPLLLGLWLNAWANDPDSNNLKLYIGVYSIFFVAEIALTTLWIWYSILFELYTFYQLL